jgi:hypothetical protein
MAIMLSLWFALLLLDDDDDVSLSAADVGVGVWFSSPNSS